jgi:hypothetical protein
MPRRGRRTGSDATALQKSSEIMSSDAAKMRPERSTESESVKTAATASPTASEIAAVAYQLWLDNGCPVGSDQEYWFRAEAMLKNALVAKCEDLSRRPSIPRCDTRTESETRVEFRWKGHWEVWEMEWGAPRWIWD